MEEKKNNGMDKAHLMAMHRAQFPVNQWRSTGQEYYEWKVYKNPAMIGSIHLEMRDGQTVGSAVIMPKKVAIQDDIVLAGETADTFTSPDYRGQGINTKILGRAIDWTINNGMELIYGTPNKANYGTHIRLGYKPCEYIKWTFLTKNLNPLLLVAKLTAKIIMGKQVQKSARHLHHQLKRLGATTHSVKSCQDSRKKDFNITTIDRFSYHVDPLWGKTRYSFFVYRDAQYLNWRYFDNPDKYIVLVALKDHACLGYIALKMTNDNRTGLLCDFATVDDRSDVFQGLVSESENIMKKNGLENIQLRCILDTSYYRDLKTLGYFDFGPKNYQPVFINAKTELGKKIIKNPGKWHFTFGDTDEV